jgi:hypothetical protein
MGFDDEPHATKQTAATVNITPGRVMPGSVARAGER